MRFQKVYEVGLLGMISLSTGVTTLRVDAADPDAPQIVEFSISNSQNQLRFTPYPGARKYKVLRSSSLGGPFSEASSGSLLGYDWLEPRDGESSLGFYRIAVTPIDQRELWVSTVLSRLAYGPTPDEMDRVSAIGPDAYIEEQLAPEGIEETLDIDVVSTPTGWQYVTATGTGSSSTLYVYLTAAGEGYIDDLELVAGRVAEGGANLIPDGDFESPLDLEEWTISSNHEGSEVSGAVSRTGNSSLHLAASRGGTTRGSAIWRVLPSRLSNSSTYTLSYWYLPITEKLSGVTVRLSGSGIVAAPAPLTPMTKLANGVAELSDLQTWYVAHAVRSKRQLLEVVTQFVDNHFTTYHAKSRDYLNGKLKSRTEGMAATQLEFRELMKWRDVLMDPNGTFYDLLEASVESPAMIIYLDTVTNTKKAPNENYARELLELFTMGVDNGYDQRDIEELSRVWTGWRVDKLPVGSENNPFARRVNDRDNDPGVWSLQFNRTAHDLSGKTIFRGRTVAARFGSPHAGESYELVLPARSPSQGLEDGYDVIEHLADLPYTQEYISVKLCRLFVHENFQHGVYDYTDPNLSPEAALVRDCMAAWETPAEDGRIGNLRGVLRAIFESKLFREHAASRQKVKTPFEFVVSAVRSIQSETVGGGLTSGGEVEDLIESMARMGQELFLREEPDGWSEYGADWINTSSLVERMRFVQNLLKPGRNTADPVMLLARRLPPAELTDAGSVADLFCELLFGGEGAANLELDRMAAIEFLNTAENGATRSPFSRLRPRTAAYENRVRGTVAMLMGLPRFQEQ